MLKVRQQERICASDLSSPRGWREVTRSAKIMVRLGVVATTRKGAVVPRNNHPLAPTATWVLLPPPSSCAIAHIAKSSLSSRSQVAFEPLCAAQAA